MTARNIIPGSLLTASAATYYTVGAGLRCLIKKLTFCNTDVAAGYTVTVYLVPSAGTAAASNTISIARALTLGETWECTEAEGHMLETGGFIQALASTTAKVSIRGTGIEGVF